MRRQQYDKSINVYQMLSRVKTLGPFSRFALWTQGCLRRCPGCISPDTRSLNGGKMVAITDIAEKIYRVSEHEGITISGGEPFLQADALCDLIDLIRSRKNYGVILYTGYTIEELQSINAPAGSKKLLERIDLMIDGPYIRELNDDASLRGSSNQRMIWLSDRYRSYADMYGKPEGRQTEFKWTGEELFTVGIPSKKAAELQWAGRDE